MAGQHLPRRRHNVTTTQTPRLSGVLVGSVDRLGPAADDFNHLGRYVAALEAFARDNCTAAYATTAVLDDAVYRLAVLDAEEIPSPETMNMSHARRVEADRVRALFAKLKANTTRDRVGVNEHLVMCHYGRRVFVTTGGLLGLGLESVMEGDLVGVVPGCNNPLLLRRLPLKPIRLKKYNGGQGKMKIHCTLVGESFIQGIMDGEALEDEERIHARFMIS
ncbi:hypothetical protein QBC33DRAFT_596406 [Phialemonium atrogriseum]|uniref:Uncharacterized protein n=1 Tax=Phialemonium atrogriseum TaxID=1093897 RepID=A0AAJ0BSP8_9PEZI|nr:uncharacterized protein QBC33DRAFT_596406 [Phialemonium atrogriseum]KAK1763779.1 hypothetical protein QBC33DRAFT_596406 [Phialemonium atrogriseum]